VPPIDQVWRGGSKGTNRAGRAAGSQVAIAFQVIRAGGGEGGEARVTEPYNGLKPCQEKVRTVVGSVEPERIAAPGDM